MLQRRSPLLQTNLRSDLYTAYEKIPPLSSPFTLFFVEFRRRSHRDEEAFSFFFLSLFPPFRPDFYFHGPGIRPCVLLAWKNGAKR